MLFLKILLLILIHLPLPIGLWLYRRHRGIKGGSHRSAALPLRLMRTLFAGLAFAVGTLFFLLPFAFLTLGLRRATPRRTERLHRLLWRTARFVVHHLPATDFTLNNTTGETFERPAVIVSNHQSHLDLMCLMMLTPRLVILTNDWVWRNPFYGYIIRRAGYFPVSSGIAPTEAHLRPLVARGYSVVVFPEGTRSPSCRIMRFHQGAFSLAARLGIDVLPVTLHGPGRVLPKTSLLFRPGRIYVEVGRRLAPPRADEEGAVNRMRRDVHAMYVARYAELEREAEAADAPSPLKAPTP